MLQAVLDALQQEDVRKKLLITGALLVVFRFVAHIPIPDVDPRQIQSAFNQNQVLGLFNLFSGGALRRISIAALGVYPYITATIIMQLVTPLFPSLHNLQKEGEAGRHKLELYQYWMSVPLALVQGYAQLVILRRIAPQAFQFSPGFSGSDALPTVTALFALTAGSMFLVWIGDLITENGIGNGISLIIFGGIVAGMPGLLNQVFNSTIGIFGLLLLVVVAVGLVAAMVWMQEAIRKIPVQYAKSVFRAGKMYRQSGQSHIPLRVNSAGMIPLIFAFSIVILPTLGAQYFQTSSTTWVRDVALFVNRVFAPGRDADGHGSSSAYGFYLAVFFLVVIFSFFYTLVVFQQQNLAENLQKQGGFVPGIRPGRPTGEYIMRVLVRITWAGAIFLGVVAVIPYLATGWFGITSLQISSTGLLIVVGVVIDTMKQLEAQLLMRNYEGFIR
ncbi:MAG: preprotein translocase subunit SecY [Dehalococcoidia bacterium]|nr:preprotein translocase subunit SecY [Dehalococcoidia bacterium]